MKASEPPGTRGARDMESKATSCHKLLEFTDTNSLLVLSPSRHSLHSVLVKQHLPVNSKLLIFLHFLIFSGSQETQGSVFSAQLCLAEALLVPPGP